MDTLNHYNQQELNQQRHADLVHQAAQYRLAQQGKQISRAPDLALLTRSKIGQWIVSIGQRLQLSAPVSPQNKISRPLI